MADLKAIAEELVNLKRRQISMLFSRAQVPLSCRL